VDYGSLYSLDRTQLLPCPEALMTPPGQAVVCSLAEVEPLDGSWSQECQDFIADYGTCNSSIAPMFVVCNDVKMQCTPD